MRITEKDVIESLELFTRVPSFLLRRWVRKEINLASKFRSQIIDGYSQLSEYDRERLRAILEMDVSDIQDILGEAHRKTGKEQLKILSDPSSRKFIEINLEETRNLISNEKRDS
ncbi:MULTISPECIES: hypothetical protein [Methanothermobacter]|uniref:Uncharacterized protein n=1 Tax=Methanothermobacter marburgensis (strain ATCC BAA-927 / DSM 2133 / JCM 14651 / NBRC 100331 / OCM 82 / Marburg) TaxID=79929 RepID=D9PUR4_METTM|nr:MULTISPECIES: hypothetical protein [Methanothermobacter]ADL57961.1 conserved hypothetical protein [Methanothermobacter marburgensis str. Marburg]QEF94172.1 hypothetical protein FVF72_02745 [Methanothermobacter sp. KEPCO-1]QHN08409.1 hypothetical protein FZP68_06515 [Methanothermobacter sp. THM-2]WBF10160.1 hypothetical protein ISG34_01795 [Methanothermobacter marburgensis]